MGKQAFLTGATGFLGRHLIDVLGERGWQITALVRDPDRAKQLLGDKARLVKGDLTAPDSLKAAIPAGVDAVFHAAADTSSWQRYNARQTEINVAGTQALLLAAQDRGVGRFMHVSSVSVFGHHDALITEQSSHHALGSWVNYAHTKALAERSVHDAISRGMDGVIVNPTHIVGHYDDQNWARLILMTADGSLPGIPGGTGNFANGRAVAEALETAFHKGGKGDSFILGGPHHSMQDFVTEVARQLDQPLKARPVPDLVLGAMAWGGALASAITGKRPRLTREEAYFAREKLNASSAKARQKLDYREVPMAQSIAESIAYLRQTGALKA